MRVASSETVVFTDSHGWLWRNCSGEPVFLTLRTGGDYTGVKEYD